MNPANGDNAYVIPDGNVSTATDLTTAMDRSCPREMLSDTWFRTNRSRVWQRYRGMLTDLHPN